MVLNKSLPLSIKCLSQQSPSLMQKFSCVISISSLAFMCNYNRSLFIFLSFVAFLLSRSSHFRGWEQLFPICLSDKSIKMNGSDNIRRKSNSNLAFIRAKSFLFLHTLTHTQAHIIPNLNHKCMMMLNRYKILNEHFLISSSNKYRRYE